MNSITTTNWLIVLNQPSTEKGETHNTDDLVQVTLLKSRYNRYATRYNRATGDQESLQISLYYQLEGLKAQIERLQAQPNVN